jgi:hypothetical protein
MPIKLTLHALAKKSSWLQTWIFSDVGNNLLRVWLPLVNPGICWHIQVDYMSCFQRFVIVFSICRNPTSKERDASCLFNIICSSNYSPERCRVVDQMWYLPVAIDHRHRCLLLLFYQISVWISVFFGTHMVLHVLVLCYVMLFDYGL